MPTEHPNLATALAAFQANLPEIGKDAKGKIEGKSEKTGKFFSYDFDYAELGVLSKVVLPLLGEQGLAWTTKPTMTKHGFMLRYALKHGASGETDTGLWPLPDPSRFDIKKLGGIITYARRYALMAVTGVFPVGEDHDAQGLDGVTAAASQRRPRPMDTPRHNEDRVRVPVPGPDHERIVHSANEPMRPWDGDDLWIDQPSGEFNAPKPQQPAKRGSRSLSPAQAIAVHFKRLGVTDDGERHIKTTILAGRTEPIGRTEDLDEAKQRQIMDDLAKLKDRAALDALLDAKRAEVPS